MTIKITFLDDIKEVSIYIKDSRDICIKILGRKIKNLLEIL